MQFNNLTKCKNKIFLLPLSRIIWLFCTPKSCFGLYAESVNYICLIVGKIAVRRFGCQWWNNCGQSTSRCHLKKGMSTFALSRLYGVVDGQLHTLGNKLVLISFHKSVPHEQNNLELTFNFRDSTNFYRLSLLLLLPLVYLVHLLNNCMLFYN